MTPHEAETYAAVLTQCSGPQSYTSNGGLLELTREDIAESVGLVQLPASTCPAMSPSKSTLWERRMRKD